ncbi:MAG: hypothetical protein JNM14_08895 [Ferruginibacter sp.]|nr:hypothetical protein [Ferruginibacter sp.]
MFKFKVIIFILLLVSFLKSTGQKYDWGKYNKLKFIEDSIRNSSFWGEENQIIYPIQDSKADIEIRGYSTLHNRNGVVRIMRAFGDSVLFQEIQMARHDTLTFPKIRNTIFRNIDNYSHWELQKLQVRIRPDSFLNCLINKGLFTFGNLEKAKKEFKQNHKKDIDKGVKYDFQKKAIFFFEVKIGNRIRSFSTYLIRYYDEKTIDDYIHYGGEITDFFVSIFKNAKTKHFEQVF